MNRKTQITMNVQHKSQITINPKTQITINRRTQITINVQHKSQIKMNRKTQITMNRTTQITNNNEPHNTNHNHDRQDTDENKIPIRG